MPSPIEWTRQEAGWYTSDLGGIVLETDGLWHFHGLDGNVPAARTLAEAKAEAERRAAIDA